MRCLLAILLSASLYSPDILKLVAYADYVVDKVSARKVNICDCEDMLRNDQSADHTAHTAPLKSQLIYIIPSLYTLQPVKVQGASQFTHEHDGAPISRSYGIFQPPRV